MMPKGFVFDYFIPDFFPNHSLLSYWRNPLCSRCENVGRQNRNLRLLALNIPPTYACNNMMKINVFYLQIIVGKWVAWDRLPFLLGHSLTLWWLHSPHWRQTGWPGPRWLRSSWFTVSRLSGSLTASNISWCCCWAPVVVFLLALRAGAPPSG